MTILFWLLAGHAVCDYPLQGDFLAKAKNRHTAIPGIDWWIAMAAHAAIHAGMVALITRSITLGCIEFVLHFIVDVLKCEGVTDFRADQFLHVLCKVGFALALAA